MEDTDTVNTTWLALTSLIISLTLSSDTCHYNERQGTIATHLWAGKCGMRLHQTRPSVHGPRYISPKKSNQTRPFEARRKNNQGPPRKYHSQGRTALAPGKTTTTYNHVALLERPVLRPFCVYYYHVTFLFYPVIRRNRIHKFVKS